MLSKYVILFFIYSVFGWCFENVCQLIEHHKLTNRGFLVGPYCPIYGTGALLIHILLKRYVDDIVALFVMSILVCSILEYITSYIMEKTFNARWWDYTDKKFNINGRICLEASIPFGLLGTISLYFINPFIFSMLDKVPGTILEVIAILLTFIIALDFSVSLSIITKFRDVAFNLKEDNSDQISEKVKKELIKKSKNYKRLLKSFPKLKIRSK